MSDHTPLYDLIRDVFNAGQLFALDTLSAHLHNQETPAAFPVITPLALRVEQYVTEQIRADRDV